MNVVVVDGYNLIRRVPGLKAIENERGLEHCREELERVLGRYALGRKGVLIEVVYDSSSPLNIPLGRAAMPGVRVRFAPCADDLVVELSLRYCRLGHSVRVVSSDRSGVASLLRGERGIEVISSEEFWRKNLSLPGKVKGGTVAVGSAEKGEFQEDEKPRKASAEDIDYWLKAFGVEEESKNLSPGGEKPQAAAGGDAPEGTLQEESETEQADTLKHRKRKAYLRRLRRKR